MSKVKLKLDENLGTRGKAVFERFGYDVLTVSDREIHGRLWIMQNSGIREYQPDNDD